MATATTKPNAQNGTATPAPPPGPLSDPGSDTPLRRATDAPLRAALRPRMSLLKWLIPGMRVKRWLVLVPIGLAPVIMGVAVLAGLQTVDYLDKMGAFVQRFLHLPLTLPSVYIPLGLGLIALGLFLILVALVGVNRSIVFAIAPEHLSELPDAVHRGRALSQGAKIVVVGGGTGLSTLLRGLKKYSSNLTAVVTMTDDGGSSGLLQRQMTSGILPPGDIRNCLVALADAEPLMQQLFQYRFSTRDEADGLSGHSFGNLFLAAMTEVTGDFEKAVKETSDILAIRGRVLPSTTESVVLVGEMADGREVTGESAIAHDASAITKIKLCPDAPRPLPEALQAIREADVIVLGPGSVFTSVVPNLLVKEIAQAVAGSRAMKIYICNVMTQPGETDSYTAADHVRAVEEHAGRRVFDYVLVNSERPSDDALSRYENIGAQFVSPDLDEIVKMGYKAVKGSFISPSTLVRHDPDKLARAVLRLWQNR